MISLFTKFNFNVDDKIKIEIPINIFEIANNPFAPSVILEPLINPDKPIEKNKIFKYGYFSNNISIKKISILGRVSCIKKK